MVNVDLLNKAIGNLDVQSKEIENVIKKQKKIDYIFTELEEMDNKIKNDNNSINKIIYKIERLLDNTKEVTQITKKTIVDEFNNIDDVLINYKDQVEDINICNEKNNKELKLSLNKGLETIREENNIIANEINNKLRLC